MRKRLSRGLACLLLAVMLTGCFQIQINGSVIGATITITRIDGVGGVIVIGNTVGEQFWIAALGEDAWLELAALIRIITTGFALIPGNIDVDPDAYYLATATGGMDNDPMRTRDLTGLPAPVFGEWHAIVKGERLMQGNLKISILTEAIYQQVKPDLAELTNEQLDQRLDELAASALLNVDNIPAVNYEDALLWSHAQDEAKYKGETRRLGELADVYETDEWDEAEIEILSKALIEDQDAVGTSSATVCASVVHAPPTDMPQFPSRIEIDTDFGAGPHDAFVMTIPGANNGSPVSIDVATDTGIFGISSFGSYKIGTVMIGSTDLTTAFATLPTITVTAMAATLWCQTIEVPL